MFKHRWTGQRAGGHPADAGSYEWVASCARCGAEADGDNDHELCDATIPGMAIYYASMFLGHLRAWWYLLHSGMWGSECLMSLMTEADATIAIAAVRVGNPPTLSKLFWVASDNGQQCVDSDLSPKLRNVIEARIKELWWAGRLK